MSSKTLNSIGLVGVPSCLGGNIFGCHKGPDAVRRILIPKLKEKKIVFKDFGDIPVPKSCIIADSHKKCMKEIKKIHENLKNFIVKKHIFKKNNLPVLIGGDHSLNYSFIRESAANHNNRLGLIWFDAHGDFNTPQITPSGNIHGMVLSAVAGRGLNREFGNAKPVVNDICIFGARDLDPKEKELIKEMKINLISMAEIRKKGVKESMQKAVKAVTSNSDAIHLSFDLDVFDPKIAPGTGTPVKNGLSGNDLSVIIEECRTMHIASVDIMELNPLKDKNQKTAKLAAEILIKLFAKK